jgi:serine/threonine protein kinase
VKELRKSEKVASQWQNEVEALSRMNGLGKKHIVRFLTAFRRGTSDDFEHYLVFEWADGGNLGDLWKTKVKPEPSVALVKWVVEQLHGLAEALTAAHYLPEIDGEHHGASYRHGDLKPENILWFREGGEFGTLKIGDWGEAKEHHEVTAVRHSTTTQTATLRYQPPEVVTGLQSTLNAEAKHVRSRLYDIWGFGCITLEFIIWLLHGEAGRKQFNKEGRGQLGYSDQFYEINSDGIASVHGAVIYWMDRMAKDNRCLPRRTAIGDLLEVVRQGLLVVKLPHDGGTIHPSDSLAPVLGHQNTTYVTTQTDEDTMQPEIAGEIPFVKVEQAKALDSGSPVARVGGVERLRATELHEHLGDILGSKQDGNYWSSGPSAMPIPDFSKVSKGHLASPSAQQPGKAGLRVPPLSPVDYGNPKLDPNNWSFVVDNTFASKFFSNSPAISSIPQHSEQSLCAKCREFCKGIRKPLFAISYGVGTLRRYAEANDCVLCWLLWKINEEHHLSTNFNTVQLVRRGSSLKSKSKEHPVISLFRSNGTYQSRDPSWNQEH